MSGYEADADSDSEVESLVLLQDEISSSTESTNLVRLVIPSIGFLSIIQQGLMP